MVGKVKNSGTLLALTNDLTLLTNNLTVHRRDCALEKEGMLKVNVINIKVEPVLSSVKFTPIIKV